MPTDSKANPNRPEPNGSGPLEPSWAVVSPDYRKARPMLLAVDCIVFGFDGERLKLLVARRKVAPYAGRWSLVGSFVHPDEDVDAAASRVLRELTGVERVLLQPLSCFGRADRDPGGRVVSMAYSSLVRLDDHDRESVKAYEAVWVDMGERPSLVLDHDRMVALAISRLQREIRYRPIGFELLPERFTMPQLLRLYRSVSRSEIDDRNFRKKFLSTGLLVRLEEKDKSGSRKGAYYYRFDPERYAALLERGFERALPF